MQAAYNWNGNKPARFCVDLSPFLTQTVEGELTSNGHQLTSQGGSVAEEGRDKDQCIRMTSCPTRRNSRSCRQRFWIDLCDFRKTMHRRTTEWISLPAMGYWVFEYRDDHLRQVFNRHR